METVNIPDLEAQQINKIDFSTLSSAQKRLFLLDMIDNLSTAYNVPIAFPISGEVNRHKLEAAFTKLIERHESLRASFHLIDGEVTQIVHQDVDFSLEFHEFDETDTVTLIQDFVKPFDLKKPPLVRGRLIKYPNSTFYLLIDIHHIVTDATSMYTIQDELISLYNDQDLIQLMTTYRDYAIWQNNLLKSDNYNQQRQYWIDVFNGKLPVLDLPYDYPRPPRQSFEGDTVTFTLGCDLKDKVTDLCRTQEATLYMTLLTVYNVLLYLYTGQNDILIGSPTEGRNGGEFNGIVGMFVNIIVYRNYPKDDIRFVDLLQEVKRNAIDAYQNQDYQFADLLQDIEVKRDISRNAVFDVAFSLLSNDQKVADLRPFQFENKISKFDLTLYATELADDILFSLEYCVKLFNQDTIQRMSNCMVNILRQVVEKPEITLGELNLLNATEQHQILVEFNNTAAEYPDHMTLHRWFEEQVEKTPDNLAVAFNSEKLNYAELNKRANQLARTLRSKNVKPDSVVAIMIPRCPEMIIGLLGILKAGGAYLPIALDLPMNRVKFMLEDSQATLLLTEESIQKEIENESKIEILDITQGETYSIDDSNLEEYATPKNLAYVIYTSGSTGQPKGTMIEHTSIVNRIFWMQKKYPISNDDVLLQKTPYSFDVSVWELFWWSSQGASLYILDQGDEKDPAQIVDAIGKNKVTTIHFVPSMLNAFLEYMDCHRTLALPSLKRIFVSGEALTLKQVNQFQSLRHIHFKPDLINLYGPTEATVDVSHFDCPNNEELSIVPIGKPIDNINLYVIDKNSRLLPVGAKGELCISGVGLARGYLNLEEYGATKFVPNPFISQISNSADHDRIYKTGDLAKWLPDGNIAYLGRFDHQIKLRGIRIELAEIEVAIRSHPHVDDTAVLLKEDKNGDKKLIAYYTTPPLHSEIIDGKPKYKLPNNMAIAHQNKNETDFMYQEIFIDHTYKKHSIQIQEGDIVFDVGANIGLFSLYVNQICPTARVFAFEPVSFTYDILETNIELYGKNTIPLNYGLSNESKVVDFTFYPKASIMSGCYGDETEDKDFYKTSMLNDQSLSSDELESLSQHADGIIEGRFNSIKVPCQLTTLSEIISDFNIDEIALLKIDVEKSEWDVLNGIEFNDWPKIKQLVIEVHNINGQLNKIKAMLETRGYQVFDEGCVAGEEEHLFIVYASLHPLLEKGTTDDRLNAIPVLEDTILTSEGLRSYLKEIIPEYEVPSMLFPIDKFPLTTNGKLNRTALLDMADLKISEKVYEAPTNDIEKSLVEIWKQVLNLDNVGINDDFFMIGGDSLRATSLVLKIYQEFNIQIPLNEIFNNKTIKEIATYIQEASTSSDTTSQIPNMVLLKKGTDPEKNFFFIHDGSGDVEVYAAMCDALEPQYNFWGIRADRLINCVPQNVTFEDVAQRYLDYIQKIQPRGPYSLSGWSLGGNIAFEIVIQLEKLDEKINFFALIDSPAPRKNGEFMNNFNVKAEDKLLSKFSLGEKISKELRDQPTLEALYSTALEHIDNFNSGAFLDKLTPVLTESIPEHAKEKPSDLLNYFNIIRTYTHARAFYKPLKSIETPMCLFAAGSPRKTYEDAWQKYCDHPIEFHYIRGNHFSIMKDIDGFELATVFQQTLHRSNSLEAPKSCEALL